MAISSQYHRERVTVARVIQHERRCLSRQWHWCAHGGDMGSPEEGAVCWEGTECAHLAASALLTDDDDADAASLCESSCLDFVEKAS